MFTHETGSDPAESTGPPNSCGDLASRPEKSATGVEGKPTQQMPLDDMLELRNPEHITPLSSRAQTGWSGGAAYSGAAYIGAPRGETAFTYRNVMLTEDTTWRGEVLVEGGVTIAQQATLTVQEGSVISFRSAAGADSNSTLMVLGRLVVQGTAADPVVFRSAGGDSSWGGWQGIVLTGSGKKNLIENCRVEGAMTGLDASFSTVTMKNLSVTRCRTGVRIQDSLVVADGLVSVECGTGLILHDSEAEIRSARISGNRLGIFASRTSLALTGSQFTGNNLLAMDASLCRINVAGNTLVSNGSGIRLNGCEGSLSKNRITGNAAYGVVLKGSRIRIHGNDIEGNGKVGLMIGDGNGVAWGNSLLANGEYDIYNGGTEEFRAVGNWWGTVTTGDIAARIYDRKVDEKRGSVLFFPPLQNRPESVAY